MVTVPIGDILPIVATIPSWGWYAHTGALLGALVLLPVALLWAWRQTRRSRLLTRALADAEHVRHTLALTEARLRRAQRIGRVGGFEIDLRSGENRRDAEYMGLQGLREADAIERHQDWVRRLHPEDRERAERRFLEAVADGAAHTEYGQEYRIVTPTGEVRWIAARAEIERDAQGRATRMLGAHVDVTELKAAEAALRDSEERFRMFAEHAPQAIYILDVPGQRLEYLSPAFERIWGEPRDQLLADMYRWRALLHPEDRDRVLGLLHRHHTSGTPVELEYRILRANDGQVRHIRDAAVPILAPDGRVRRVVGIAQDITSHRLAEAAQRASDERLALASANAQLGVWEMNTRGKFGIVNAEFRALYGLPPSDAPLPHGEWLARVHPDDRERMRAASAAAQAGLAPYDEECRIIRADTGEERWIATRGSLVGGDPAAGRMVGICYDVTARRQQQERQMLLAREVDHRAKNVLAVVQSIVKLTRAHDPRSFAEAVEGRVAALARAHTLLSRDMWTGASVREMVQAELLAYGGGSQAVLQGPDLWLNPDAVQALSMVVHELATNAAKYGALSRPGGQVAVSWRLAQEAGQWRFELDWAERGGPPVAAPTGRAGFGTTVIATTVRGHLDGTVRTTWEHEGLHCAISAPASRALATPAQGGPTTGHDTAAHDTPTPEANMLAGCRVMVVEDEPLVALQMEAILEDLGCEPVGPAATLAEALQLAGREGPRLDAAVMDVNLRGQASFPIAEVLAGYGVAVIYVTGYGSLPAASTAKNEPAPTLLQKPLRDGDLERALHAVLEARHATRQRPAQAG